MAKISIEAKNMYYTYRSNWSRLNRYRYISVSILQQQKLEHSEKKSPETDPSQEIGIQAIFYVSL